MKLELTKPLCYFDLETTGLDTSKDRIVQIAILKIFPDGSEKRIEKLVNPEMNIPKEASDIHGITNEKVDSMPTFKQIAKEVYSFLKDSDLAGYNLDRYDIPLLAEELYRAEIDFDFKKNTRTIDVQTIFHKKEPRDLTAALKFYCNKDNEQAHDALNDIEATKDVFEAQLEKYPDLEPNIEFSSEYSSRNKSADYAGKIIFNQNNKECLSFGKHKDKEVEEIFKNDPSYIDWMINQDFPPLTKKVLLDIINRAQISNESKV